MLADTDTLPIELERASEKFDKAQARIADNMGHGQTDAGIVITREYIGEFSDYIRARLSETKGENNKKAHRQLVRLLRDLSPEVLALCLLQNGLHSVALCALTDTTLRDTALQLGRGLSSECWAAGLLRAQPELAVKIEKAVRKKHGSLKYRQQSARSIAKRGMPHVGDYKERMWTNAECLRAGEFGLNLLLSGVPTVFVLTNIVGTTEKCLTITEGAQALADAAIAQAVLSHPVYLPSTTPPRPWTGWDQGGTWDPRLSQHLTLLRARSKATRKAVEAAIKEGTMQPALDALNALQAVPWRINAPVLGVMRECIARGVPVKGLPPQENLAAPEHPCPWDEMSDDDKRLWRYRASKVKEANLGFVSERALLQEDICTAEEMGKQERFWTPMNCDWRGRVYGVPSFNFQREDRVRSLFMFADGEPIGDEGIYWLKVHVANCGDFGKISKQPFEERVQWVDKHKEVIDDIACVPLSERMWLQADKPFLFLAACMEYVRCVTSVQGSSAVTSLPISFDGSCSGLQHLCAMTRAPEGALVNLTPQDKPQDVYHTVAERVAVRIAEETERPEIAKRCTDYGIDRKVVKRNVMTYSYSSKKFGMADQHREDLMKPLAMDVLAGKFEEHPFGEDAGYAASIFLASHIYDAIEEVVHLPAQAMAFLQRLAAELAEEGKPVVWTSPIGVPWINRYHAPNCKRYKLWLHDRGVKVPYEVKLAVGSHSEIDARKATSAIAPNFVHACDAAHLLRVVNASVAEGITALATVHDSFGCLASQAARFRRLIREEFVRMYQEHDPLAEVLQCSEQQLGREIELYVPERGPLDIEDVLDAEFAFA